MTTRPPITALRLEELTSDNPAMRRCLTLAREAARGDLPILLLGEPGTGKTLLAGAIHTSSPRADRPFVSFNASAMSETLLESQLFGHEKGAFTGAAQSMRGKFELADGGTLFFDEIADMSELAQAKILRAVEYGEFARLGSETTLTADVRIISATNRPLRRMTRENRFREDLYYRLTGITLVIPPLRDRREDLPGMIANELQLCAAHAGKTITGIDREAFERLLAYPWPGNLRELHRVIQAVVLFTDGDTVHAEHVIFDDEPPEPSPPVSPAVAAASPAEIGGDDLSLETALIRHVRRVYELCGRHKTNTARRLGITRATLDRKLARYTERFGEGE